VAVRSQLNPIRQTARNVVEKRFGRLSIPIPNHPTQDQLAIGVNCYERPGITSEALSGKRRGNVLGLRGYEAPKLIDLNPLRFQVYQRAVQVILASRAKFQRELLNRVLGAARHPRRRAYRIAFNQSRYDLSPLGVV
jgi:hypothetical protein